MTLFVFDADSISDMTSSQIVDTIGIETNHPARTSGTVVGQLLGEEQRSQKRRHHTRMLVSHKGFSRLSTEIGTDSKEAWERRASESSVIHD
jgi:hypothetical protein